MEAIKVYIRRMIDPIRVLVQTLPTTISMFMVDTIGIGSKIASILIEYILKMKRSFGIICRITSITIERAFKTRNRIRVQETINLTQRSNVQLNSSLGILNSLKALIYIAIELFKNILGFTYQVKVSVFKKIDTIDMFQVLENIFIELSASLGGMKNGFAVNTGFRTVYTGKFHILGDFDSEDLGDLDGNDVDEMDFEEII